MKLRRRNRSVAVDIMPLVDVVFLLLTFFVFSLALLVRAEVTDITLPALAGGRSGERGDAVTVTLDAGGGLQVGRTEVEVGTLADELRRQVEAAAAGGSDGETSPPRILLVTDAAATAEDILRVMLAMRDAEVGSFGVVTRPSEAATGDAGPSGGPSGGGMPEPNPSGEAAGPNPSPGGP